VDIFAFRKHFEQLESGEIGIVITGVANQVHVGGMSLLHF
jgi:hypothetical protein